MALNDQKSLSVDELTVQQLLPHREPILLLEQLLHCDDDSARVSLTISSASPFYNRQFSAVPAWVGIEYMAQAIAVWSGYQQLKIGRPIMVGFLLGSRRYQCYQPMFNEHQRLEISVMMRYVEKGGLAAFDCRIESHEGELLAKAAINAFRPDNPAQFVAQAKKNSKGECT